jgi:hypothetical protein
MVWLIVFLVAFVSISIFLFFWLNMLQRKNSATLKVNLWFFQHHPELHQYLPSYEDMYHDLRRWTEDDWMSWLHEKGVV